MSVKQNKIIIISGPSGAGEDSVIEGLKDKIDFNRVITTVTRKKRLDEREGQPYYFIGVDEFKKRLNNDEFVEWAIVYDDYRGCTHKEIKRLLNLDKPVLWKLDWQGVKTVKKAIPDAVSILIAPTSYEELKQRIIDRGQDSMDTIMEREEFTKEWLKQADLYDHVVINKQGELDTTINQVAGIINKALNS